MIDTNENGPEPLRIRVTVLCEEGTTRARAEQLRRTITRYAEARPSVSHAFESYVYDDSAIEPDDEEAGSYGD